MAIFLRIESSILAFSNFLWNFEKQLGSSKRAILGPWRQLLLAKPSMTHQEMTRKEKNVRIIFQVASIPADRVPDMEKRKLLNLLLLGALSLPSGFMLVPYDIFFAPPGSVQYPFWRYLETFTSHFSCFVLFTMDWNLEMQEWRCRWWYCR